MNVSRAVAVLFLCCLFASAPYAHGRQPEINAELLRRQWDAGWVACPGTNRHGVGVYHFRRSIELERVPDKYVVHVSADNRYKLYVNGEQVGDGPARGDILHWRFETYDLARYLKLGLNQLAAVVWNFGDHVPFAQMTRETGFLVQGDTPAESAVNTTGDNGWKVKEAEAYEVIPVDATVTGGFTVVGPSERLDGRKYQWNWLAADFDDSGWESAERYGPACPRGIRWMNSHRHLTPRTIPPMEHSPQPPPEMRRVDGPVGVRDRLTGLVIPPHSTVRILLDQGHLTAAYPVLRVSGGRDAEIGLAYAEALVDEEGRKGHRDSIAGNRLRGYRDEFIADGGAGREFTTLWWRTFRYLELDVKTADRPLTIDTLYSVFTGYPFERRGEFSSDDPSLQRIMDVAWRTARLCAGETYFDCPYYEQLNYIGDTRIQALISLYAAGDGRLARKAVVQFDDSRLSSGLTQSRYPTYLTQVIPPYSLLWVAMVHDWWMHRGEPELVRSLLPGINGVIRWFAARLGPSGMNGPLEWWNFADWADEYDAGVPPGADEGGSALISLQLVYAALMAAEMADSLDTPEQAVRFRRIAGRVGDSVMDNCWDEGRGLLAETPSKRLYSQHSNVMAVLTGLVPGREREVMRRVLDDRGLVQCTYYYRFYLNRALKAAGMGDEYLRQLGPWRDMLDIGLTTFAEKPEPTRSDCHAWSASPLYDLPAVVCGVTPAAPGFAAVRIEPSLGHLNWASCKIPHPDGEIACSLTRRGESGLLAEISLPVGVTGTFVWNGERRQLDSGAQTLELR